MLILDYKLRVNQSQQAAIDEAIRTTQFIRNKCVRKWMDERSIGDNDLQVYCAQLAREYPFAARLNSQARQTSADRAWLSIARFYKNCREKIPGKKGYPRFVHDNRSVEYKTTGWVLEPDGKRLTFTDGHGIGTMRCFGTRKQHIETFPTSQIKRVRLVKRADGYYVQFAVKADRQIDHQPTGKQVGIDVGLKAFYTDSQGQQVDNPRYLRKAEAKLKRLHRRVSRKVKQSKNRKQAIKRLAKGHLKVSRQRKDFAVKAASALVKSSDLIAYEDLKIASLVKNHKLAKSISDASWGLFLSSRPVLRADARHSNCGCLPTLHDPGLQRMWVPSAENALHANPYLPSLRTRAGSGLECRAQYSGCCPGGSSPSPYRRAGGNGFRFAGTHRFWTDRHDALCSQEHVANGLDEGRIPAL